MRKIQPARSEPFVDQQYPRGLQIEKCAELQDKNHLHMQPLSKDQPSQRHSEFNHQALNERFERDVVDIFCEQEKQIESLQETVSNLINQNKLLISRSYDRMNESVSLRSNVLTSNQELQDALNGFKTMSHTVDELQSQISQLKQSQLPLVTPRSIIVNNLLDPPRSIGKDPHLSMPVERQMIENLKETLDMATRADEALHIYSKFEEWLGTKTLQSVTLVTCCVCQKIRFRQSAGFSKPRPLNEFIERDLRLGCESPVCSVCFLKSIFSSLSRLRETWWKVRGLEIYLPCPCGCSPTGVHINDRGSLLQLLQYLGNEKAEFSVIRIYDTVVRLMRSLYFIEPRLTSKVRKVAARLHSKMIRNGLMYSPFDRRYMGPTRSKVGSPPDTDFNHVELFNVDEGGKLLQVPIFTRFFRTVKTPIECVICTESIYNISYDAVEQWIEVCMEFDGDWVWKISKFPKILRTGCSHPIDFCSSCLQKHIESQLELLGRGACNNIRCPSQKCQRLLLYEEIKLYAQKDVFLKYDEYLKLEALRRLPSFFWCLADNCSSGQTHDLIMHSQVSCVECGFPMCFTHQVKWHDGLTCEQYDLKKSGDPEFQETRQWMRANTKPCPECGINVQKGDGCFHMTCALCRHQFCWECLASWRAIMKESGGYDRSAHNDGCYFKNSSQQPMEVRGTTICGMVQA